MRDMAAFIVVATAAAGRRQLREEDLHYGLDAYKANYNSRVHHHFSSTDEHRFHRRLFEHEVFVATRPDPNIHGEAPPDRAGHHARIDRFARTARFAHRSHRHRQRPHDAWHEGKHADASAPQPEVKTVVPLLPELKVTPHFESLLPKEHELHHLPSDNLAELIIRLIPMERHEHLRKSSEELVASFRNALARACEDPETRAEWQARKACAKEEKAADAKADKAADAKPAVLTPKMAAEGERTIVVSRVHPSDAMALSSLLAHVPEALWVEPKPVYRKFNADAAAITQSGSNPPGGGVPVGTKPIHDMNIHGEDEIIGVGDSGLDAGHCFFEDKPGGTAAAQTYSPAHRKVVAYRAYADGAATGTRDHGTHVVGSILGETSTPGACRSRYNSTAVTPRPPAGIAVKPRPSRWNSIPQPLGSRRPACCLRSRS